MKLYPYNYFSKSARNLAGLLEAILINPDKPCIISNSEPMINWGSSSLQYTTANWINHPEKVKRATNKLSTFQCLQDAGCISTPDWTTKKEVAQEWYDKGNVILARTVLTGHSGNGIVVCDPEQPAPLPAAPLYVRYVKKSAEYRVHVGFGSVWDIQAKRKQSNFQGTYNSRIRSHHNGWVFCRDGVQETPDLSELAIETITALGLDFGAVDIIFNSKQNRYYVLEVNTAPGLEGETLFTYHSMLYSNV